jgi:hypothetical protein
VVKVAAAFGLISIVSTAISRPAGRVEHFSALEEQAAGFFGDCGQ